MKRFKLPSVSTWTAALSMMAFFPLTSARAATWKGPSRDADWDVGAFAASVPFTNISGYDVYAFSPLLTIAQRTVRRGFLPDINNDVSGEAVLGPFITPGEHAYFIEGRVRWDINQNSILTYYATLGISGLYSIQNGSYGIDIYLPQVSLGVIFHPTMGPFGLRAEYGTAFAAVGLNYEF